MAVDSAYQRCLSRPRKPANIEPFLEVLTAIDTMALGLPVSLSKGEAEAVEVELFPEGQRSRAIGLTIYRSPGSESDVREQREKGGRVRERERERELKLVKIATRLQPWVRDRGPIDLAPTADTAAGLRQHRWTWPDNG